MKTLIHRHVDKKLGLEFCVYKREPSAQEDELPVIEPELDFSKFDAERDVYTSAEIAARILGKPVREIRMGDMRSTTGTLASLGLIKLVNGGKQVRWPTGGNPVHMYAIRNAEKYNDVDEIKRHIRNTERPEPSAWAVRNL